MSIKFATDAKLVCMGRYLMIPAYLGANIEGALFPKNIVDEFGATPEEIFAGYSDVKFCINNGLSPHGEEPVLEFFYRRFLEGMSSEINIPDMIKTAPKTVFNFNASTTPAVFGMIKAKTAPNTGSAVKISAVWVGVVSFWSMVCPANAAAVPSTPVKSNVNMTAPLNSNGLLSTNSHKIQ